MKKFPLFTLLLIISQLVHAQTYHIGRYIISAMGNDYPQMCMTVGEIATQEIQTGSFLLTQGFQQTDLFNTALEPLILVNFKLYPNPTRGEIRLDLTSDKHLDLTVDILDIQGRKVRNGRDMKVNGFATQEFDVSAFPAGTYLLRITGNGQIRTLRFQRQ